MIGKTLGSYQILEELGRGGMAVVYRAYQPSLNRYVAIKVLPPQLGIDQQFVERFQREARAAAGLRHPNIVVIHDVGQQDGIYYIVMEYLEGRTLKQVIEEEGPLPPQRAARITEQVAAALDYAHQQGFVHRDIKPANIFVGKAAATGTAGDHVTLTDFGIAKAASEAQQLTRTGMLMGTPEYMSPEQAEGGLVDQRTDLYALGVVLYQMLLGRVPFRGTTPHATLHAVIYEPPPSPRQINPNLSPALEATLLKAVAKRPEQRFQSGAEMVRAFRAAAAGAAPPPTMPRRGAGPAAAPAPRRSAGLPVAWIVAGMAVLLMVIVGAVALLLLGGNDGTETPVPSAVVVVVTPTRGVGEVIPTAEQTPAATPPPEATASSPTTLPELPSDTPGVSAEPPSPVPPSDTPTPTNTPKPPTDTPTPTRTPTITPSPTPTVKTCAFPAQGLFAGLWQAYKGQLGCPLYASPQPIQDAEQAFDNGHMFWRQDNDYAYVVYESGAKNGTYQAFTDLWTEGDPEYSCAASPPAGRVQPKRGFGKVWCNLGGPSAPIGWGLGDEAGFGPNYGDPLVQDFEWGFIFRDSDGKATGRAYVFFSLSATFVRVSY